MSDTSKYPTRRTNANSYNITAGKEGKLELDRQAGGKWTPSPITADLEQKLTICVEALGRIESGYLPEGVSMKQLDSEKIAAEALATIKLP